MIFLNNKLLMIPSLLQKTYTLIYQRIIDPILKSQSSIEDISWGVAIGLFLGFTPTMGVQMYIATGLWIMLRFLIQFSFNLPIACAMVWISNPLTVIPMYYAFFATGSFLLHETNSSSSFAWFQSKIKTIQENFEGIEFIIKILEFLIIDLGYPMVIGSLFYAIPVAFGSFFITKHLLIKRRK